MPYSTVERVDCMVAEQYNISSLRGESTLSTERQFSLGIGVVIEGIFAEFIMRLTSYMVWSYNKKGLNF